MSEIREKLSTKLQVQKLKNQLLTGYKLVERDSSGTTTPLTDEDRIKIEEEIKEMEESIT